MVQNGVETGLFSPRNRDVELRKQINAEGKFVVSFIGTIGLAHGLETVIAAAERLGSVAPDVMFMLLGEGADRERIVALAAEKNLHNICFVDAAAAGKDSGLYCGVGRVFGGAAEVGGVRHGDSDEDAGVYGLRAAGDSGSWADRRKRFWNKAGAGCAWSRGMWMSCVALSCRLRAAAGAL